MSDRAIDDEIREEVEGEEAISFPPAERRVVTQPVDLSVQTLVEQWNSGQLYLPEIQREYVWDNAKASRLIESLMLNIPIPVMYFAETADAKYEVFDGHQRVRSIVRFIGNEFALGGLSLLSDYKRKRFQQLPEREQRFLRSRTIRVIIITVDSSPSMKFEIFERLNTGSISLNAQELRNSIYRGKLNDLLKELAKNAVFRELIGTKSPRKRMVDEELVLRFLALKDGLGQYRPSLKRFLNDFMDPKKRDAPHPLDEYRASFEGAIRNVKTVFGLRAFRVLDGQGRIAENTINRALFDAEMLACSWIEGALAASPPASQFKRAFAAFADAEFLDSIQRATGDRSRTLRRLRDMVKALRALGLKVKPSTDLSQ